MNHNRIFKKIIALTVILVLFSGCSMFPEEEEALAPPLVKPTEVTYETEEAVTGTILEEVEENCTVAAVNQYTLKFPQTGVLLSKEVTSGTSVTKGQVLAKLDSGDAEVELANAEINLEVQKINLERALSKGLPDTDTKGNKVNFDAQIIQLQIKQTELQIAQLKETIDHTTLYAPVDGVVTFMTDITVGQAVDGYVEVCCVADLSQLVFEYSGSKAEKLSLGMEVTLTVDGKEYAGKVTMTPDSVPAGMEEEYGNKVRITPVDSIPNLSMGKSAKFKAVIGKKENTVIVPKSAVTGYTGSYTVKIYQDGIVMDRAVEVGIMNSSEVEILNGVDAGELVVVK